MNTAHDTEVRLISASTREELQDREVRVRDLRDLLSVSPGLDSEHKRQLLESSDLFTAEELNRMVKLTDDQLHHDFIRLESRLKTEQKRFS